MKKISNAARIVFVSLILCLAIVSCSKSNSEDEGDEDNTSVTAVIPSGIAMGDASVRVTTSRGTVVCAVVIVP